MSERTPQNPGMIAVGLIRKAIGLKGLCAVEPFGFTLETITVPLSVCVGLSENSCSAMVIERVEKSAKGPACFFAGITEPGQAEKLRGSFIYVERTELPRLREGEYYHFELVGLKVRTDQGMYLGDLVEVHNFPSVDSIEVKRPSGETTMIPLVADALADIDRGSGYLTVRQTFVEDLLG